MVHILEITCEPIQHGGQEQFILNTVRRLSGSECRIDVLTPYFVVHEDFAEQVRIPGGEVYSLGLPYQPGKSRKQILGALRSFLKGRSYDTIHIHSGSISAFAYAARAAKENGTRQIIVHAHSTSTNELRHRLIRALFSHALEKYPTDYLACSLEAGQDKFPRRIVENEMVIIPNGIDLRRFSRDSGKRREMRDFLGIAEEELVLGHIGRFVTEKNHDFLIDCLCELREKIPASRLLLVGNGERMEAIRREAEARDLAGRVIFAGNVRNTEDYYQTMDIFLFPSFFEGFGYAALEAQAIGIPCIMSTGVPKSVAIGENVVRLPLEEPAKWLETIEEFRGAEPADNTQRLKQAGYEIGEMAAKIKDIYIRR